MIQIAAQMKILVAIEPVDGRKYAPSIDMRSVLKTGLRKSRSASDGASYRDAALRIT
jgi:hypothetical protein